MRTRPINRRRFQFLYPRFLGVRSIVVVAIFAICGYALLNYSHAATYSTPSEVESGVLAGNAAKVSDATASAGSLVKFGVATSISPVTAPANLKAYVGGTSIALRWDPGAATGTATIKQYNIFRDGTKIATVDPSVFNYNFPDVNGCAYIDMTVTNGGTYSYQVQAQDSNGLLSGPSTALNATQPLKSQTVAFTVDTSKDPTFAPYINNMVIPFLQIWYPKMAALLSYPDYESPTAITVNLAPTYTGTVYPTLGKAPAVPTFSASTTWLKANPKQIAFWMVPLTCTVQNLASSNSPYCNGDPDNGPKWLARGILKWSQLYLIHGSVNAPSPGYDYVNNELDAAAFLNWIEKSYGTDTISKLSKALYNGTYQDSLWTTLTGHTLDQLDQTFRTTFTTQDDYAYNAVLGYCLGTRDYSGQVNDPVTMRTCRTANTWRVFYDDPATKDLTKGFKLALHGGPNCFDLPTGFANNNYALVILPCDNTSATQNWKAGPNNSIINTSDGLCLDTYNQLSVANATIELYPCAGLSTQQWILPQNHR